MISLQRRFTVIAALLFAGLPAFAQGTANGPQTFSVATVRANNSGARGGHLGFSDDRFQGTNQTLNILIKFAYNLNIGSDSQLAGVSGWMGTARFDVEAKVEPQDAAALKALPPPDRSERVRSMVRALLADRFGLKVHRETRSLPAYALLPGKAGPKLIASHADASTSEHDRGTTIDSGKIEGKDTNMKQFAAALSVVPEIRRAVVDQTGLAEKYDFTLQWAPQGQADDTAGPSLFTALQEQLGLKLDPIRVPTEVVVIDHVEEPQGN